MQSKQANPTQGMPRTKEVEPLELVRVMEAASRGCVANAIRLHGGETVLVVVHRDVHNGEIVALERSAT